MYGGGGGRERSSRAGYLDLEAADDARPSLSLQRASLETTARPSARRMAENLCRCAEHFAERFTEVFARHTGRRESILPPMPADGSSFFIRRQSVPLKNVVLCTRRDLLFFGGTRFATTCPRACVDSAVTHRRSAPLNYFISLANAAPARLLPLPPSSPAAFCCA